MPTQKAKAHYQDTMKRVANTSGRRYEPKDIPLGNGALGNAKKAIQTRESRIERALREAGG
jgi:hypothetical protein